MIEQTDLVVTDWNYFPPEKAIAPEDKIFSYTSFDVMRKRVSTKKGIACRFTCSFVTNNNVILEYIGEDSYVIDLADVIDKIELIRMIRNSFSKYNEKFEFRKLGTVLQHTSLSPLDESNIDLDAILPLLV
jgi:hypothetical protein